MRLLLLATIAILGCLALATEAYDHHVRRNVEKARSRTSSDQQVQTCMDVSSSCHLVKC